MVIMDTLAFWLPLAPSFFRFGGTALKRRARDHCLKKIRRIKVVFCLTDRINGRRGCSGSLLKVLSLPMKKSVPNNWERLNRWSCIRPKWMGLPICFVRHLLLIRVPVEWDRELQRIGFPSFWNKVIRAALNFYNMLRDAFGQASKAILGAINKDSAMGEVKNANKHVNEIGSDLTDLVPNTWEQFWKEVQGASGCR